MKTLLLISFDYKRLYEDSKSYSVASLLAYLKRQEGYDKEFQIYDISINMEKGISAILSDLENKISKFNLKEFSGVAISVNIWNDFAANDIIEIIRSKSFKGNIILGGHQIDSNDEKELHIKYPKANIFIKSYGEESLHKALLMDKRKQPIVLNEKIQIDTLPSVYLSNELSLIQNQEMVRMESQRGCIYKCSFCAFRDFESNCVKFFPEKRVFDELILFHNKNIQKINFIDPVFNNGKSYQNILHEIIRLKMKSLFSFQTRFESINGKRGEKFLDSIAQINAVLEFGLQTISEVEMKHINRKNNLRIIKKVMSKLKERKIKYEVSIIYGLPFQTIDSFKRTIEFVQSNGCDVIKAYPLMLLPGSALYYKRKMFNLKTERDSTNIPLVVSSNSFNRKQYDEMKRISKNLTT